MRQVAFYNLIKSNTHAFQMNDSLYKIALTKIPKVGPVTAKNLVSYCGGIQNVFEARKKELLTVPGVGPGIAKHILEKDYFKEAEAELEFIENQGIQLLSFLDEAYPHRLKPLDDAPLLLYYKGTADLNHPRIVSIIGTRKPSTLGVATCEQLVEELADYGVMIVSGLAYGIDVTAHKKSIERDIATVGVLGHGLKQIYPSQHRSIAQRMIENGGLLTEFTSDTKVEREHFPMRNRIVAGMCDAVVVVETAKRGGSMITAMIANEYNKDVFAFPGRINDLSRQGCNHLIKTHKAALIESAKDIGYIMRWEEQQNVGIQRQLFVELDDQEQKIVDLLKENNEMGIDKLSYETKLHSSRLASILLNLEFQGIIKTMPGKRYLLVR